ncbi:MAG: hypothetical protein Q9191_000518 [Dirinaria sp. TL-2023a]
MLADDPTSKKQRVREAKDSVEKTKGKSKRTKKTPVPFEAPKSSSPWYSGGITLYLYNYELVLATELLLLSTLGPRFMDILQSQGKGENTDGRHGRGPSKSVQGLPNIHGWLADQESTKSRPGSSRTSCRDTKSWCNKDKKQHPWSPTVLFATPTIADTESTAHALSPVKPIFPSI